jgi:cytochrome oxidase Cu insertion factor (SCO1/SenC/PrrC family)
MKRRRSLPFVLALILFSVVICWGSQKMQLPKPQGSFQEGQPAPDFSLKDQDGNVFRLADQHGAATLLIFYRGYW